MMPLENVPRGATYWGSSCIHGHDGKRYVRGGQCVACSLTRNQAYKPLRPNVPNEIDLDAARQGWLAARAGVPAIECPFMSRSRAAHFPMGSAQRDEPKKGSSWRVGWGMHHKGDPCPGGDA